MAQTLPATLHIDRNVAAHASTARTAFPLKRALAVVGASIVVVGTIAIVGAALTLPWIVTACLATVLIIGAPFVLNR